MDALLPNGSHPARLKHVQSMLRARFSRSCINAITCAPFTETKKFLPLFVSAIVSLITFRFIIHILAWVLRLVDDLWRLLWRRPTHNVGYERCIPVYIDGDNENGSS
ncbi:jg20989 [Pararge aegeria aegeria]|uniref:Jg20989 protein n=1 Tax=Pararge aegeria aegeria TaxID=348720 RepID=A0A8S4R6V4_9NEOP|nr:jg20989 [Pararge aegeria aegeria]